MLIPRYFDIHYLHFQDSKVLSTSKNHDITMVPCLKSHGNTMVPFVSVWGLLRRRVAADGCIIWSPRVSSV